LQRNNQNGAWRLLSLGVFVCALLWSQLGLAANAAQLKKVSFVPLPNHRVMLRLQFNRAVANPKTFVMKEPARLVMDFKNVRDGLKRSQGKVGLGVAKDYLVVSADGRLRVILNLKHVVRYKTSANGRRVFVTLAGGPQAMANPRHERFVRARRLSGIRHGIRTVDFRGNHQQGGQLVIGVSDAGMGVDVKQNGRVITATFFNTRLPSRLVRRYNVSDFSTPIRYFVARQQGRNAVFRLYMTNSFEHFAYQVDKKFIVDVKPMTAEQIKKSKARKPVYKGKRISLNFQNIKVRSVLQLLAEFTGVNMVVSDSVKGHITLRLRNVPWDQALDIILKTRGLAKRKIGGILMIAPSKEMYAQEEQELKANTQVKQLAPIESELIQIRYAKAEDIVTLLKNKENTLLSARGNVSVDKRTNTIWLQDTAQKIEEIRDLIHKLDKPVKQVLIEARVVTVDTAFEKDLGARFGVTNPNHLSGTLNGANQLAQGVEPSEVEPFTRRLNVDLPAPKSSAGADPASIGLAVAKLGAGFMLDLELSALESEGRGEVISSPHLVTANQQPALIESGEEIPYEQATSSGATSVVFKKAVLSLQVTPQITPDKRVVLDLIVNQDVLSEREINGVPAINTKELQTRVLVDNGQTVVLGGVYTQDRRNRVERVPLLGSLPVIGHLFRHEHTSDMRQELLIFITPKIIHQSYAKS
jgi:type IV pilus assembly protein PilQ